MLTVRGAKFGKDRLVPLHASSCNVLRQYLAERGHHWADRPVSSYVFVSNRGHRLGGAQVHRTFYALSRQIGLRGASRRTATGRACTTGVLIRYMPSATSCTLVPDWLLVIVIAPSLKAVPSIETTRDECQLSARQQTLIHPR